MAAEALPSEFDVVVLGTGLVESVVAAACARVGQRVLHLDQRSYYAGKWASFTFNGLLSWIEDHKNADSHPEVVQDWSNLLEEGEELIRLSSKDSAPVTNLQVFCYASEEKEEGTGSADAPNSAESESGGAGDGATDPGSTADMTSEAESAQEETTEPKEEVIQTDSQPHPSATQSQSEPSRKKISYTQLLKEGRRFNIDLVSKLMYSRGSLVDLLIKSNVSRYAEFKNVTRILTYRHGKVEQVPCSRADVFASRQLTVVEKRMLMKFLTSCLDDESSAQEHEAFAGRPYLEFLRSQKLTDNLQHFLLHSIAMVTEDTPTEEGLASTRHFLRCLGRYGNTPFLFPLYGLGEIPQCFCRMCAVFGGIYCLRHSVNCLVVDKDSNKCKAVIDTQGQRISCSHFVVEEGYIAEGWGQRITPTRSISRAVLITDGSLLHSDSDQQVSIVTVPSVETGGPAVRLVELCPSSMTCIPGTYLVHLTCQSIGSAHQDLSPIVSSLFQTNDSADKEDCAHVLWCVYFNMADSSGMEVEGHDLPSNIYICRGPDSQLGHQQVISQAEQMFQKIVPAEEFCPPAPNPEDILYEGETADASPSPLEEEETGDTSPSPPEEEEEREEERGREQEEEREREGDERKTQEEE
ncbi:rab proteins geranylgeranyltransferase component A 1 isoform X2 [Lampris incognitus]|uniref:rab proteins geranylgeranyltransferase component A 1 isoform X2 n=1 Tax=Lampris incognitus TaxID=2546036 RepID=UPI0024B51CE4|nr:rab proteins geranylgeranyltransferase component A 1 isoform X2 [Lampris incognitus]